ncbi:site-specific DNA-methyltransferase [Mycoplasmopsis lipophila]|uniref:site-specific DNA-methyltransferase n=1 Tax=Mycoplasmopsis lipophila TaxID=2117 RepID=UPI00387301B3
MKDLNSYLTDIDEMSKSLLNQDQKDLIKNILIHTKKENLDAVFQLLIQKVKIGFTFDAAPSLNTTSVSSLKKDEKLSFVNNPLSKQDQNVLIIGENYDALKNLIVIERERERERDGIESNYDLIYIDPPYNTESASSDGNNFSEKDEVSSSKFIYRDKFSRNGWLNMMNERLKLAHQLLKDDGVIFVSIDDNEQAYLKILMDEIFGEENFVCNLIWQKKNEGSADDSKYIKSLTEYVLMYSKNINKLSTNDLIKEINDHSYNLIDEHYQTRGMYKLKQLDFASLTWSKNLDYVIEHNGNRYYAGGSKENWEKRKQGNHTIKDWQWRWSNEKVKWGIDNGFIEFKNNKIYTKQYQFVNNDNEIIIRKSKFSNLILNFHGTQGTSEQKTIFSNIKVFDHPKPLNLLKYIINLINNKNARVLDFFAGSGTTGHAVLELNREDGGNRTYTLVTNNENEIGENVCYERLFRINNGEGTNKEKDFDWLKNNDPYKQNLDVFKIEYFNTDIYCADNTIIKETFINELNNFNIFNRDNYYTMNNKELLLNLTSLKPQKEDK